MDTSEHMRPEFASRDHGTRCKIVHTKEPNFSTKMISKLPRTLKKKIKGPSSLLHKSLDPGPKPPLCFTRGIKKRCEISETLFRQQ
ncbi:hypothetical protein RRG08_044791 [Elysia crispata]|uniref:Uncharacterized protein n=1 Tax=Elysia crispata TaxID=231223 RepID=A0AAE0ZU68_9GAST|nr:hypothetical protein RRG08_044791 [Elysia crispata]